MNECPKCGARAPALLSKDRCPFCFTFYSEKKESEFLERFEGRQQLDLEKLEIIHGKKYADEMRKKIKAGDTTYSLHLDPQYENLSLDELKRLFSKKPGSLTLDAAMKEAVELVNDGKFEQSISLLDQILNVKPYHAETCFLKGKASIAIGDFKNALEFLRRAKEFGIGGFAIENYGMIAFANVQKFKKPDLSPDHLKNVDIDVKIYFRDERWIETAANFQMLGEYEKAYKAYHKALTFKPNYESALKNIKRIEEFGKL